MSPDRNDAEIILALRTMLHSNTLDPLSEYGVPMIVLVSCVTGRTVGNRAVGHLIV